MNLQQFESLEKTHQVEPTEFSIDAAEFTQDATPRTLLYGYDCDRNTWHVYLLGGKVQLFVYRFDRHNVQTITDEFTTWDQLVPNKRLYPEACDAEFCAFLKNQKGVSLPFTTFDYKREPKQFHGEVA